MSYNEITVGDKTVQGHRYVGSGHSSANSQTLTLNVPVSHTVLSDCVLTVFVCLQGAPIVRIDINNNHCGNIASDTSSVVYQCLSLPLKKDDVVEVTMTNSGTFASVRFIEINCRA